MPAHGAEFDSGQMDVSITIAPFGQTHQLNWLLRVISRVRYSSVGFCSVSLLIRLQAGRPRNRGAISGICQKFCSSPNLETCCAVNPSFSSFSEIEVDLASTSSTEANVWSYTSLCFHVFCLNSFA